MLSSQLLKLKAKALGFNHCGVAPAEPVLDAYAEHYREWLRQGGQADMHYLENYLDKRFDPRLLVEGTRSVVSVCLNYRPREVAQGIAWYAQGRDYHDLMRERMTMLMQALGLEGRVFVDTAPVPERYWAWRCGLGWIGKHHQLVIPHEGSTFFLGELFITAEVDEYDVPMENKCGTCTRCIEACPTGAIGGLSPNRPSPSPSPKGRGVVWKQEQPSLFEQQNVTVPRPLGEGLGEGLLGLFYASKCLSYLTIENRGPLPEGTGEKMGAHFYGCDRCLQACPHLHVAPTDEADLQPSEALLGMTPDDWQHLTREQYQSLFKGSAVKRAKYEGLMRNIQACSTPAASRHASADKH